MHCKNFNYNVHEMMEFPFLKFPECMFRLHRLYIWLRQEGRNDKQLNNLILFEL